MSNLISILNSGESLEKSVVLTKLAFEHNFNFYSSYDKIKILYSENLPKKEKELLVHGSLGGIIKGLKVKNYLKYNSLDDLWEDRNYLLNKICVMGRISKRMRDKIRNDKKRFDKIIPNFPWHFILEDFKDFLIKDFFDCNGVSLKFLNFRKKSNEFFKKMPFYNLLSKSYLLNPNGSISSRRLWKGHGNVNIKKQIEPLTKSIVLSPNVNMFLLGSHYFCYEEDKNSSIGFRKFNKIKRNSYNHGIKFLYQQNGSNCVEEPKNKLFNNLLDKVDKKYNNISIERKINLAIYGYLNKLL